MFLRSFLMLIIVFVVGMIVSSYCSRFRVSIVMVSVKTSFLVFDGNDAAECVSMCCIGVYSVCVKHL